METITNEELIKMKPSQDIVNEIVSLAATSGYDRDKIKMAFKCALCGLKLDNLIDFDERCIEAMIIVKDQIKTGYIDDVIRKFSE